MGFTISSFPFTCHDSLYFYLTCHSDLFCVFPVETKVELNVVMYILGQGR